MPPDRSHRPWHWHFPHLKLLKDDFSSERQKLIDHAVTSTTSCYVEFIRNAARAYPKDSAEWNALHEVAHDILSFMPWDWYHEKSVAFAKVVQSAQTDREDRARRAGAADREEPDGSGKGDPET